MALSPGMILGQYEIRAPLGAGGMGEVYRAHDTRLDRDVAIKVLPESLTSDPERLRRFEQEARATAALNHPNILAVYQMATQGNVSYLVEELLDGETLRERLRRGPIPLRKVIDYGVQIAHGLAAAHDKGIIHRDLKPENLFLTKDGRVKVLDFGLARLGPSKEASGQEATVTQNTDPGVVLGTAGYMSPEQVRGKTVDNRTDIFALGTILYEMVTGKQPFRKPTSAETMAAILNDDPPSISQISANTPPGLQRVVHRCLEKDPDHRFHSAHDLAFAFEALSDSSAASPMIQGAAARPGSAVGSRVKWLAAAILVSALALGLGWWYWNHKPKEKGEIQQRQLTARTGDNPIQSAVISRDGKLLAYSDTGGISIQEIETGETHKLPGTSNLTLMGWYPDGLRLLTVDDKHNLLTLFAVTGEQHKMASNVVWADLSPDGSQIAFTRDRLAHEVWTMPTIGGEAKVLFAISKDEKFSGGDWSPDSKAFVYVRLGRNYDLPAILETRNLENGESRSLLTDASLLGGGRNSVSWLPGGRIVFELYKGSNRESDLWELLLDSSGSAGGKPVRLTNTTGVGIDGLSASSDGKRLAVLFLRASDSLFIANLSGSADKLEQPVRLTNDYWHSLPECWTSDSQTLFYSVDRNDQGQQKGSIYKRQISSDSGELVLTGPESYSAWSLSPDGAWVIATANRRIPGKGRLLRIPTSGGAPETILDLAGVGGGQCTNPGSSVCVLSEQIGKQAVFTAFDPVVGRKEELARINNSGDESSWSLSPDGKKVAFVENLSDHVAVLTLASKQTEVIHPMPPQEGIQVVDWSPDGKRLFLTAFPPESKGELLEMDPSGSTRVLLKNPGGWIGVPRPSPDGKRIAYTYTVGESNVTLLEHF